MEKAYNNIYFLNIANLGNDIQLNNSTIPIPIQHFNYKTPLNKYKELTLLLSYLLELPVDDVEYLQFIKKGDNDFNKYKLNHKKYEMVMRKLRGCKMPTKKFDLDKEFFYKDVED